jgi:hypothetical protein
MFCTPGKLLIIAFTALLMYQCTESVEELQDIGEPYFELRENYVIPARAPLQSMKMAPFI